MYYLVLGPFPGTPVVCTLPVLKMSHMVLYDYYLRLKSEGTRLKSRQSGDNTPGERAASMLRNATGVELTLDDVDESLEHARMVKFGQRVEIVLSKYRLLSNYKIIWYIYVVTFTYFYR